jgi:hypothetical protein
LKPACFIKMVQLIGVYLIKRHSIGIEITKKSISMKVIDTMGNITETEKQFLNELVKDCITFRLTETEAVEYIETRFHAISLSSYKLRKSNVLSDKSTLNHFTRIGFVSNHKKQIENIEAILEDSLKQFFIEKNNKNRDERKI